MKQKLHMPRSRINSPDCPICNETMLLKPDAVNLFSFLWECTGCEMKFDHATKHVTDRPPMKQAMIGYGKQRELTT
jgi:ribosomal protein L37AE/L43A